MITFYNAKQIDLPIWADGIMTSETEKRITVMFIEVHTGRGGFRQSRMGSFIATRETTLEQVFADFPDKEEDLSGEFAFEERENSDFCKVVAL